MNVRYIAPWKGSAAVDAESMDMIIAQAVMQYVPDIEKAYNHMHTCLRRGGFVSLTIDYSSHGLADEWDGHWVYSERAWRLIRGTRPYFLNRRPHSEHWRALKEVGFEIAYETTCQTKPQTPQTAFAHAYLGLSDEDRSTRGAHILARKL